jgi:GDP-4-dehydro-6-deoxy-D-mannose reductase
MRVLITGARGFSGKHLSQHLSLDPQLELFGTDQADGDLSDPAFTTELLNKIQPQQIYHLAGSFTNDYSTDYRNNVAATKNILDTLSTLKIPCRVLLIGSSAEYGDVLPSDNPIREDHPLKPLSFYGLTKVFQTHLMQFYHHLDLVMGRTFNLCGEGMSPNLFVGRVYHQIYSYKKGEISKISLGSLKPERDYIDIEDAVRYYQTIMNKGKRGEIYNVGSGRPTKIATLLEEILKKNGLSMEMIEEKAHPSSLPQIYANIQKVNNL